MVCISAFKWSVKRYTYPIYIKRCSSWTCMKNLLSFISMHIWIFFIFNNYLLVIIITYNFFIFNIGLEKSIIHVTTYWNESNYIHSDSPNKFNHIFFYLIMHLFKFLWFLYYLRFCTSVYRRRLAPQNHWQFFKVWNRYLFYKNFQNLGT